MLDNLRRRSSSPTNLLDIIARGAHALAHEAGAARRAVGRGHRASGCSCSPPTAWSGRGSAARRSSPRASRCSSVLAASAYWFLVRAAAPPGDRRAGGAVSRRARAVAAGHAAERGRDEPERPRPGIGGARAPRRRAGHRSVRAHRRVAARRAAAAAPLRAWRSAAVALVARAGGAARSGVPAQRDVGDAARVVERRRPRRRIASRSRRATSRCRRARTRPITAKLLGFDSEDVVADGAARRRAARSSRCRWCATRTAPTKA